MAELFHCTELLTCSSCFSKRHGCTGVVRYLVPSLYQSRPLSLKHPARDGAVHTSMHTCTLAYVCTFFTHLPVETPLKKLFESYTHYLNFSTASCLGANKNLKRYLIGWGACRLGPVSPISLAYSYGKYAHRIGPIETFHLSYQALSYS